MTKLDIKRVNVGSLIENCLGNVCIVVERGTTYYSSSQFHVYNTTDECWFYTDELNLRYFKLLVNTSEL